MTRIAILYFSGSGTTHLLAEAVKAGLEEGGATVHLLRIQPADIKEGRWKNAGQLQTLHDSDAIVFGSPTYMGGPAAHFKAFIDSLGDEWFGQKFAGKLAGGFTISSSPVGDKQSTLLQLAVHAAQHNMVWVNAMPFPTHYQGKTDGINRLGSFLGMMAQQDIDQSGGPAKLNEPDRLTGHQFGKTFAERAAKLVPAMKG